MTCDNCLHKEVCYKKDWIITHEHAEKDCHDFMIGKEVKSNSAK